MSGDPPSADLDGAYALRTPADAVRYYRGWAADYDAGFAARVDYRLPELVAAAFAAAGGGGPVLDAGAGTGLVGVRLAARGIGPIDALDISPEMLAEAAAKGVYRELCEADLTAPLPRLGAPYAGIVSAGTFTHGHVGPAALDGLLALAAPGAVFAFSVNAGVWDAGFAARLDALGGGLAGLAVAEAAIYGAPDPDHAGDRAMIVTFRRR
jgi:predicted TPR repeat methyltransferase